ncbi:MAG TPA: diguanylate cyclase, partial [Xanthomonadaceae bacterium]|nr:diguanylate cyclase [Xanthomonadaceae bacterium]
MASVVLVQLATMAVVQVVTERSVRDQLGEQLEVAGRVWQHFHDGRDAQLLESVSVLADDFGFKAAVASNDLATMRSALANQGSRLGADFGVLLDEDGEVSATLVPGQPAAQAAALGPLFEVARREGAATGTIVLGGEGIAAEAAPAGTQGTLYRVALVPVLAPVPIAWVAMGTEVDAAYANEFSALTGLEASFVGLDGGGMQVYASSLPPERRTALEAIAGSAVGINQVQRVDLGGEPYYAIAEPVSQFAAPGQPGNPGRLAVLLQASLAQALEPYAPIRQRILMLTALVTLLALGAALWLARSVTRPLSTLAGAAHRVGQGDYSTPLAVRGNDELAQLGNAFARMQDGIAEREAQIVHQATHDPLTALPNRSMAVPAIESALARGQGSGTSCAVLLVDLNRFKEINDTLGHAFGDQVLVEVAKRLRATVRAHDAVLRLGADEFLVVLDSVEQGHARARATALLHALREPLDLPDTRINLDACVGMALCPEHGDDPGTLLRRADIALYDAKDERQGVAVYRSGREETHLRRLTLMSDLHKAEARGELRVEYQPKVDLAGGRAAHAEALLRWDHPQLGAVPPDEFIPLAEHAGSVQALTRFVVERALAENARWRQGGLDLGIAVNLSAMDLADPSLVEAIEDALH